MKVFLSIKEKKKIVGKAFAKAKNIKAAVRQYGITLSQIHQWEKTSDVLTVDVASTTASKNQENKMMHNGERKLPMAHLDHLKATFARFHDDGCPVSVGMLVVELCHLDASYAVIDMDVLKPSDQSIIQCHVIHVAPNHRWNEG